MPNLLFALFIAVLAPSVLLGLLGLSPLLFLYVAVIGSIHAIFLALPSILLLRRLKRFNIYTTHVGGFLIGAIPLGILLFPKSSFEMKTNSYVSGSGQIMMYGEVMSGGWAQYFVGVAIFGVIGVIFAAIFWATFDHLQKGPH